MTADKNRQPGDMDVRRLANLARIDLSDEEVRLFEGQLEEVLGHVRRLQELDVSGVEPTAHAVQVTNVWRDDLPEPGLNPEDVLDNAPCRHGREIRVPRIVE